MFSAWCQSVLLTADCFCVELSRVAEFKASLEGRLSSNYEILRLYTGKSNEPGELGLQDGFVCCKIFINIVKIKSAV